MADRSQCPACGEGVEVYDVDIGGGVTEVRCLQCGLPLQKLSEGVGATRFLRALVADDSPFFLQAAADLLRERRLAGEVLLARDGAEAVELFAAALRERKPPSLVVLDLLMPRLNGLHAAVALRAVERAFGSRRAEVLFLSGRRLDPTLRPLLEELAPAYYLNKGAGGGALNERLEGVLVSISSASRRGRRG